MAKKLNDFDRVKTLIGITEENLVTVNDKEKEKEKEKEKFINRHSSN